MIFFLCYRTVLTCLIAIRNGVPFEEVKAEIAATLRKLADLIESVGAGNQPVIELSDDEEEEEAEE